MAFDKSQRHTEIPQDWDAGLREKFLSCVSDPTSGVVQFPARDNPHRRMRRASLSTTHYDLVPQPTRTNVASGYRVVTPVRRATRMRALRTYVGTIVAAVIIGTGVGFLAINPDVQDRAVAVAGLFGGDPQPGQAPALMATLPTTAFAPPADEANAFVPGTTANSVTRDVTPDFTRPLIDAGIARPTPTDEF